MYSRPTTPQGIGQLLDSTFKLTAASYGKVWVLALLLGLSSVIAVAYQFTTMASAPQDPTAVLGLLRDPVYWALYFAGICLGLLFSAAMNLRIAAIGEGREIGGEIGQAMRRWPVLIITFILYAIAVFVGCLLLLVPGIILGLSLALWPILAVLEDTGPFASLGGSHRLIWGNWWRTMAILVVALCITFAVYLVLGVVSGFITPFVSPREAVIAAIVSAVIVVVLEVLLIVPFFAALLLTIYWDLKLRKQGGDLATRIAATQ